MTRKGGPLRRHVGLAHCLLLCALVAVLFLVGAPSGGAFSWPDSPRHALNGAFVMDLIAAAPIHDPVGYAYDYYSRYPALTILFYPPLLYFVLAPFYAVFGVSQETALLVLFLFYCLLATGGYHFARLWLKPTAALGAALILAAAPEVAFWGRQVMLEVPAFALLTWSAWFFVRHLREGAVWLLYASIAVLVLAIYTKLSVAFVAIVYLIVLLANRRLSLFRDRHSYIIAGLGGLALAPLIFMTLKFGQANVQSVVAIDDSAVSRLSIEGWLWYLRQLPGQLGWPALLAAVSFIGLWLWRRRSGGTSVENLFFLFAFFLVGYLFYSAIDLKEARLSIFLLLPLCVSAGLACVWLFGGRERLSGAAAVALGLATLSITLLTRPVLYVDGYRDVVDVIAAKAPENSNVLFSGYRDGSFIFAMRAYANRPDVSVVRADKLLLRVAVRRELGVAQQDYSEAEIADRIADLGIRYVVAQPDFWVDLEQMRRLQDVLHGERFKESDRFRMTANYPAQEKELVVYETQGRIAQGPIEITNELPIIGDTISGSIGEAGD